MPRIPLILGVASNSGYKLVHIRERGDPVAPDVSPDHIPRTQTRLADFSRAMYPNPVSALAAFPVCCRFPQYRSTQTRLKVHTRPMPLARARELSAVLKTEGRIDQKAFRTLISASFKDRGIIIAPPSPVAFSSYSQGRLTIADVPVARLLRAISVALELKLGILGSMNSPRNRSLGPSPSFASERPTTGV